jgi:hypothetical protein
MSAPHPAYSLAVSGLGELRRLGREAERAIRELDAVQAHARIVDMKREAGGFRKPPDWFGLFLELALVDTERLLESLGSPSGPFRSALKNITTLNKLLGPRFRGLRGVAECDSLCSVCGLRVPTGAAIVHCAANETDAHLLCGELAR